MIGLSIKGSARAVYDVISMEWAKILMDARGYKVSFQCVSYCDTNQEWLLGVGVIWFQLLYQAMWGWGSWTWCTPGHNIVATASYIIAFHQSNHVKMLSFSEERAACTVFGAVSDEWAKVLVNRRHSKVSFWADVCCNVANQLEALASYGSVYYVRQCKQEVLRYHC